MIDFFELSELDTGDAASVAFPVAHGRPAVRRLKQEGVIEEVIELSWSWASPAPPADFVWTVDGIRLVSSRVREVFEAHRGEADHIQWLAGTVIDAHERRLPHWVPHFPVAHDLLDHERSQFGPSGLPIRYVFSRAKLAGHGVTISRGTRAYIVSASVVDAMREAGIAGGRVTPAPVA